MNNGDKCPKCGSNLIEKTIMRVGSGTEWPVTDDDIMDITDCSNPGCNYGDEIPVGWN
ncbi:MAG: hypothetical protein MI922_25650 [Bacteroidales bacterium]|nr:hypothetical protein [Bacteroidales bacterium]